MLPNKVSILHFFKTSETLFTETFIYFKKIMINLSVQYTGYIPRTDWAVRGYGPIGDLFLWISGSSTAKEVMLQ